MGTGRGTYNPKRLHCNELGSICKCSHRATALCKLQIRLAWSEVRGWSMTPGGHYAGSEAVAVHGHEGSRLS